MARKITNDRIIEKDLFKPAVENAKALLKVLDKLEKQVVDLAKVQKKALEEQKSLGNTAEINKAAEAQQKLSEAELISNKLQLEKIKLQKRLKEANSTAIDQNEVLKVQLGEQRKANKQLAKETLGLVGAYEKQSKRLVKLRKEYKDLIISEGKATKGSKKLLRAITELDRELKEVDESAGQFGRSVGDYPETLANATSGLLALTGAALGFGGAVAGLNDGLAQTEEGSEDVAEVAGFLSGAWDKLKSVGAALILDTIDLVSALKDGVSISNLGALSFSRTSKSTEDFSEKLEAAAKAQAAFDVASLKLQRSLAKLGPEIEKLNGQISQQLLIAGDTTKGFDEIEAAAEKAQRLQIKRAGILIKFQKLEVQNLEILIAERKAVNEGTIRQELELFEAQQSLQALRNDLTLEQLENDKLLRENARDRFERELDFTIDAFDVQKTVNERRIADERKTLTERQAILTETERLAQSSFDNQLSLLKGFTKETIDLNELSKESDEAVIRERLRAFTFDDVTLGRILEIIKERKLAIQDLADANRDLSDAQQERQELEEDIIDQELALRVGTNEAIEKLEQDREDNEIKLLTARLDRAQKGSIEFLRIQQQLNDALLNEQQQANEKADAAAEKAKELDDKRLQERLEAQEDALKILRNLQESFFEKRLEDIDKEISAEQRRQDALKALAEQGIEDATDNLANSQKRQAELARDRERQIQRQKRIELGLTALETYNAKVQAGDDNPLGSTFRDILALQAFISSLPAFYEGTENVGQSLGAPALSGKDGHIVRVDSAERIVDPSNNAKLSGISNNELGVMADSYRNGLSNPGEYFPVNVSRFESNDSILRKFDSLETAIKGLPARMPQNRTYWDDIRQLIVEETRVGNRVEKNLIRPRRLHQ